MNIIDKLELKERLNYSDGLKLYDLDLPILAKYANSIRKDIHSNKTYFNINRHINPTNICKDVCQFCAYSASRKNPNQYTMNHNEIMSIVDNSVKNGAKEIHVVSAHNNLVPLNWYFEIFSKIKDKYPKLHIKALTAAEINFLAKEHNLNFNTIIDMMSKHGVDSMPGGGAEIFNEAVRKKICAGKVSSNDWLEIHKLWHKSGKESNATMLFGHIESNEDRIDHILRLRDLQDETNGFNAFIPLVYQTKNNFLKVESSITANDILKTIAISRIMLDNIKNIKAYWVTTTMKLSLLAQEYGANDLDGTIEKESINSKAGANSSNGVKLNDFIELIKNSGFRAIERDSLYNELKEW